MAEKGREAMTFGQILGLGNHGLLYMVLGHFGPKFTESKFWAVKRLKIWPKFADGKFWPLLVQFGANFDQMAKICQNFGQNLPRGKFWPLCEAKICIKVQILTGRVAGTVTRSSSETAPAAHVRNVYRPRDAVRMRSGKFAASAMASRGARREKFRNFQNFEI